MQELAKTQQLLKVIDKLTNTIQELETKKEKDNLAYFIHQLIEEGEINTKYASQITAWQLRGKKDMFYSVKDDNGNAIEFESVAPDTK